MRSILNRRLGSMLIGALASTGALAAFLAAARDRAYRFRIDDDGSARILFGDGETGRRPPAGRGTMRATYGAGLGRSGDVARTITLLAFGVALIMAAAWLAVRAQRRGAVRNPEPAEGGAEAEAPATVRETAPEAVGSDGDEDGATSPPTQAA